MPMYSLRRTTANSYPSLSLILNHVNKYVLLFRQINTTTFEKSFLGNKIRWFQCTFLESLGKMHFIKQI